jgi:hypothetical protein
MTITTPVHMSIRGVCARHDVSRSHLYHLIGAGHIRAVSHGRRILVVVESADGYFAGLPAAKIAPSKRTRAAKAQAEGRA